MLKRLTLPFDQLSPEVDESPLENELPHDLAIRLASQKAEVIATRFKDATVIGSDQVAVYQGQLVEKPGSRENAIRHLQKYSGGTVRFLTAVAVFKHANCLGHSVVETTAEFRQLSIDEITRYVDADQPFDCAGSFRAESLGITLFESVFSQDPTAIIGLPLIETARLLRKAGFYLP